MTEPRDTPLPLSAETIRSLSTPGRMTPTDPRYALVLLILGIIVLCVCAVGEAAANRNPELRDFLERAIDRFMR